MNEQLLAQAKQVGLQTGRSLTAVIEDAVRAALARRTGPHRQRARVTTVKGRGLRPGVDLDRTASLLDLLDRDDAVD